MRTAVAALILASGAALASSAGATGELAWNAILETAGARETEVTTILHVDDAVVLAGWVQINSKVRWLVLAVEASTGVLRWQDLDSTATAARGAVARNGRVYAAGNRCQPSSRCNALVRAYDVAVGAILWEDEFDNAGLADEANAVTLSRGRLFVLGTTRTPGAQQGFARAHDLSSGALLWSSYWDMTHYRFAREAGPIDTFARSGRLVVASNDAQPVGPNLMAYRAFDVRSGDLIWEFETSHEVRGRTTKITARAANVFGTSTNPEGLLYAFDARDGRVRWEIPADDGLFVDSTGLATRGRRVFVAGQIRTDPFFVRAYGVADGRLLWESALDPGDDQAGPKMLLAGRTIYVASLALESPPDAVMVQVWALDSRSGEVLWTSTDSGSHQANIRLPDPALGDDLLYLGVSSGRLRVERADPKYEIWAFEVD